MEVDATTVKLARIVAEFVAKGKTDKLNEPYDPFVIRAAQILLESLQEAEDNQ